METGLIHVQRALLSVSDKAGIAEFAKGLVEFGVALISTGKTAEHLRTAEIKVTDVAEVTGYPEMLEGRVKTLHPAIHAAILASRRDPEHQSQLEQRRISPIDLVAVNLYPFEATIEEETLDLSRAIEQIDIGGPALIRSAAKNLECVVILTHPGQYPEILREIRQHGGISLKTRLRLAQEAFQLTTRYEGAIATFLSAVSATEASLMTQWPQPFPPFLAWGLEKVQPLRYGENPHQQGALYRWSRTKGPCLANAEQLQGKALSYSNLLDLDAALHLVLEFSGPAACLIKHSNPCGVAIGEPLVDVYQRARSTDLVSAYGGVVGLNRIVDEATAKEIASTFVEAVIAPEYTEAAKEVLRLRTNLRIMRIQAEEWQLPPDPWDMRRISGGLLLQERDRTDLDKTALAVVTKREPTPAEWEALGFAWKVAKHVKSNAVVFTTATTTVGIGAGQMSRVDSCRLAVMKAQSSLKDTVVASDAFFPFRDGIDAVAEAGATAVIQPGGSVRDPEIIQAAEEHGMAMVFTGIRHFRH
ncbi:MAG: bifunctional phosphoribosylaminoimidazolecarboxamide formyltransferase/IMP cyclohydrolase [Candidatus Methylomirabilales bacterium]|nr:bifunctional phosphoribosylaminoimidazolecarboxamide formyltransferase/IMP cyclohydrolase [candidate division NC10 bacterium]